MEETLSSSLSPFLADFVVFLPDFLVYPAHPVVVHRLSIQLVLLPHAHPLVPVSEVQRATALLQTVLEVSTVPAGLQSTAS